MITDEALDLLERGALPSDAPAIRELVAFYRRFAGVRLGDLGKPDPHFPPPKKDEEVGEAIARAYGVVTCDPLVDRIARAAEGTALRVGGPGLMPDISAVLNPRRATPAEEAALEAAAELVGDPGRPVTPPIGTLFGVCLHLSATADALGLVHCTGCGAPWPPGGFP